VTRKKHLISPMLIGLAALALTPVAASATNTPALTYPTGTLLPTGAKVKLTSIGVPQLTVTLGGLECTRVETTGTLSKNTGSELEIDIESASSSGTGLSEECTPKPNSGPGRWTFNVATNGLPWCLRSVSKMVEDEVQIRGGRCSEAARPIRFTNDAGLFTCTYERTGAMVGTVVTDPEDAVLQFAKQAFPPVTCGSESAAFDLNLTLERDEEGAKPMYIS
jgi:hypothetical protein